MTLKMTLLTVVLPLGILIVRREIALVARWLAAKLKGDPLANEALDEAADVLYPKPPDPPKAA